MSVYLKSCRFEYFKHLGLQPQVFFFYNGADRASLERLGLAAKCAPEMDFQKISTVFPGIRRDGAHV